MNDTIEVNGEIYVKRNTCGEQFMLVCVDNRGLSFVGDVNLSGTDEQIVIRKARCVIRWGTTKHLAELVKNGPLPNTKLGEAADVIVFRHNLQFAYRLKKEQWQ